MQERALTKIDAGNRVYRRALVREAKFWKGQTGDPTNPRSFPQALLEYRKEREGGDRYDYLKALGPFRRGLSIGCGSAVVEIELLRRGIVKEFTFIDISEESLSLLRQSLPKKLKARVNIARQDINFITLEEEAYDFIFCANVLHHVINLEHVLLEINKALSSEGIFFLDDFIGEDRFQFSDKRIEAINAAGALAQRKAQVRFTPMARTSRKVLINNCPFEAIRSEDLYRLVRMIFKRKVREAAYGGVSSWMNVVIDHNAKMPVERKRLEQAAKIFVAADKKRNVPPMTLTGIYRKNPRPPRIVVRKWTREELKHHLPVRIVDERIAFAIGQRLRSIVGPRTHEGLKRLYFKMRG